MLDDVNESEKTVVRGHTGVTSSFSMVYVRLYQMNTGKCYDTYMETNHTYVNGYEIQGAVTLSHGDYLSLGTSLYQFQCYYPG